jgi:sugar lactone lactonase YvrE
MSRPSALSIATGSTTSPSAARGRGRAARRRPAPRSLLVGPDGRVYTGTDDGHVHALDPATSHTTRVAATRGRPLGLEWLPDGRLLVCDAVRGLLAVTVTADQPTEDIEVLVAPTETTFLNNATVLADGTIFFTDSSAVHPLVDWKGEVVEDTCSGRLLRRTPEGTVSVVVDGVRFANGVTAAADASYVVVAELNARRLLRHWLRGERAGETEPFAEDLPGYPDNIALGSDGLIWVAIASPRDPLVELLHRHGPAWLKRRAWRLPERLQPRVRRTARVQAYDQTGRLVADHDLDASGFHMVTGVREHDGTVWLGSLDEPRVACFRP